MYLIHYLGENFHFGSTRFKFAGFDIDYVGVCLISGTLLASVFAACLLQPWKQHGPTTQRTVTQKAVRRSWPGLRLLLILVTVVGLLAAYVGVGLRLRERTEKAKTGKREVAQGVEESQR